MSEYLESSQVKVYPSAFRSPDIDLEASRFTEGSITKLVKTPLSKESFIKMNDDGSMTLVLGGYVFTIIDPIDNISSLFNNQPANIYAFIAPKVITSTTDNIPLTMLVDIENESSTLDDVSKFKALAFSDTKPNEENYPIQIRVLVWNSSINKYIIPGSSKLIIDSSQIKENSSDTNKSINQMFKTIILYDLGQIADSGEHLGLQIDDEGKIEKLNLGYTNAKPNNDDYSFIDGISVEKNGSVSVTRHTISDANATTKGLVTIGNQEFKGVKTFKDGIISEEKSSMKGIIGLTNEAFTIETLQNQNLNITTGTGKLNYNGFEVATKDYMQNSGISHSATYTSFTNNEWFQYETSVALNNYIKVSFADHPELKKRCLFRLEWAGNDGHTSTHNYYSFGILESCFYVPWLPIPVLDSKTVYSQASLFNYGSELQGMYIALRNYREDTPGEYNVYAYIHIVGLNNNLANKYYISWKPID